MQLHPFAQLIVCDKCGSTDIHYAYQETINDKPEHLVLRCRRCSRGLQPMATIDKDTWASILIQANPK